MVFQYLSELLTGAYACAGPIEMADRLDDLNLAPYEREELAGLLTDRFGVELSVEEVAAFETVEDMVAGVEDRL